MKIYCIFSGYRYLKKAYENENSNVEDAIKFVETQLNDDLKHLSRNILQFVITESVYDD